MAVVRWLFEDPVTLDSWQFEINPNEGGSPAYSKNIVYSATCAPDGKVVVFEGRDEPKKLEFSGVLLTQEHFEAFAEWYEKRYQVNVTDDLGRTFSVIIDRFDPTRQRALHYPWKHTYRVSATIVDWV